MTTTQTDIPRLRQGRVGLRKPLLLHPATRTTPPTRQNSILGVIYGVLLWADTETATRPGLRVALLFAQVGAQFWAAYVPCSTQYASRAVQFHPHGGQSDCVRLPARTPHGGASYIQFRLAPRTYAPWGCIVRVVSQTESRKVNTHLDVNHYRSCPSVRRYADAVRATLEQVRPLAANPSADDPLLFTTPSCHVKKGEPSTGGVNNV